MVKAASFPMSYYPLLSVPLLLLFPTYAASVCDGADCVVSGGWDNFANNLGTDLAPLLALFGEQVTKQFMSESMSSLDSLLFCLAPLGVITAMISSIRVAGSPGLRALVGRAKESRGEVEADLMSSTSTDVCELWNGDGVVRVLGRPVLLQLVRVKEVGNTWGIYTFNDAIDKGLYTEKETRIGDPIEQLKQNNPPNLSINICMVALPWWMIVLFIGIGMLLQGGVLVYAVVVQYVLKLSKNDEAVSSYGIPLFVTGTIFLALGMFLCAEVVETSTVERSWVPAEPETTEVIWLQQGGQTVGDQRFESFARCQGSNEIITSGKSQRANGTSLALLSVGFSLVGFVAQFIALRAMHATVIVAQLGAVLIMTAIRSCAHIQRERRNDIDDPEEVEGHELDWLAKRVHGCLTWEVAVRPAGGAGGAGASTSVHGAAQNVSLSPPRTGFLGWIANFTQKPNHPPPSSGAARGTADTAIAVMHTRARLAELSKDWVLQLRDPVARLQTTLDRTINEIYATTTLTDGWKTKELFQWSLPVQVLLNDRSTTRFDLDLTMTRDRDQNGQWRPWVSTASDLEAVMSLWMSSIIDDSTVSNPIVNMVYLGLATPEAVKDYQLWIHRQTPHETAPLSPMARYFGYIDAGSPVDMTAPHIFVQSKARLDLLCAQHIYTAFMCTIATEIQSIGGSTERRATEETLQGNLPAWMHFRLSNTKLGALAAIYSEAGLGTIEEAYFAIIPAFRAAGIVPSAKEACREARQAARSCEQRGDWVPALEIDGWLCKNKESTEFDEAEMLVMFAEAEQRLLRLMAFIDREVDLVKKDQLFVNFGEMLWDTVSTLCRGQISTAPYSFTLAWCIAWLCANRTRLTTIKSNGNDIFELGAKILQTIDLAQDQHLQLVLRFIHQSLANNHDPEAETLALLVWNATAAATASHLTAANIAASQALLLLRQKRNLFMDIKELGSYINDPVGNDTRQNDPMTADILSNSSIAVDLQLLRPYRTPLQCAAEAGRLDVVQLLLSSDPGAIKGYPISPHGRTALQAAAGQGHHAMVEYLLSCSADVHHIAAVPFGRTALQAASEGGHTSIVQLLIAHDASPNEPSAPTDEMCTLFRRRLIAERPETIGDTGLYTPARILHAAHLGITALQAAARNGHEKVVELLLTAGARTDTEAHGTALQAAAVAHLSIVEKLLAAGADVNSAAERCGGRTALQAAAEAGQINIVRLLLRHNAAVGSPPASYHGRTALAAAAEQGHVSIVELLLAETADIDAPAGTSFGATALQAAARGGHTAIVEMLLEAGADPNLTPALIGGRTALAAAAGAGHTETVKTLLKYTVHINAPASYSGRTALQAAAEGGHRGVVEILLKERAEVNAPAAPGRGRTALTAAAGGGNIDVVRMLLKAKGHITPTVVEEYGHPKLEEVAGDGELGLVEMWLSGFPPVKNQNGFTPLEAAVENGHVEIVDMLLKEGARVTIPWLRFQPPEPGQTDFVMNMMARSTGLFKNADGKTVRITPPPEQHDMDTAGKMLGPHFDGSNKPVGTLMELARKAGQTDIIEMLVLAEARENATKNPISANSQGLVVSGASGSV